jgi:hypothetical protein
MPLLRKRRYNDYFLLASRIPIQLPLLRLTCCCLLQPCVLCSNDISGCLTLGVGLEQLCVGTEKTVAPGCSEQGTVNSETKRVNKEQ